MEILQARSRAKVGLALAVAVLLGGCVTPVERPAQPGGSQSEQGATYSEAAKYVQAARANIEKRLDELDNLDTATKQGVGVGVGGAAALAAFGAKTDPILGALTLGALSYTASRNTDPRTVGAIYVAGLDNLDCIENAGWEAVAPRVLVTRRKAEIQRLIGVVRNDIAAAAATGNAKYKSEIARADLSIAAAEEANARIDDYLASNPVPNLMIQAARKTIYVVNQEVRSRTPDINAIGQSGAFITSFLNTGAETRASVAEAAGRIVPKVASHGGDLINERLVEDQNKLRAAIAGVADLLKPASVTGVAQCKTVIAAAAPLALANPTPVELTAGETIILRTASGAAAFPKWSQDIPNDVTVNSGLGGVSLTARADAKTKTYKLRLTDFNAHPDSEEFALNVRAAAKPAPHDNTTPNSTTPNESPVPPPPET
jgi:hypothetical protein